MTDHLLKADAPQMTRCDKCGLETRVPGLLQKRRKSFSTRQMLLCGQCVQDSVKDLQRFNWVFMGICLLVIVGLGTLAGNHTGTVFFIGVLVAISLFSVIGVLMHELGHALMAKALGWQVCGLMMGFGKLLWQRRMGDTLLQWRFVQIGGLTMCVPSRDGALVPLQGFLVFFAGPITNGLAAWVGWKFYPTMQGHPFPAFLAGYWIFFNLFVAALNLLPFKSSAGGATLGSDGYQMLQAITNPRLLRDSYLYSKGLLRCITLRQLGDLEGARRSIKEHLRQYPADLSGIQCLSALDSDQGDYKASASTARQALWLLDTNQATYPPMMAMERDVFDKMAEAALKCNLAHAMLKGNIGEPAEALDLARQAYESIPWMYAIQHTYGYALAKNGEVATGLKLMEGDKAKLREEPEHSRQEIRQTILEVQHLAAAGEVEIVAGNGSTF